MYEMGKGPIGGNPRVAQSKRGRELRAAAALKRFEQSKQDTKQEEVKEEDTEEDDYEDEDADLKDATDANGKRLLDSKGQSMVRICSEEDADDVQVKQEMEELVSLEHYFPLRRQKQQQADSETPSNTNDPSTADEPADHHSDATTQTATPSPEPQTQDSRPAPEATSPTLPTGSSADDPQDASISNADTARDNAPTTTTATKQTCAVCSLTNDTLSPTCTACGNVLDPRKDPKHWRCKSEACKGSEYVNSGDAGVCGICGMRR
jgi:DNA-dependent metalloprotease WSS1